ncbi:MAG: ABC transporter ATP-binding protein [Chloroflexota bacterium]|jgi:ATP-binding cassette subfamily B protein|nr:ABC transporter ATP-binding protein/permease [Chloroflexota bacterium]
MLRRFTTHKDFAQTPPDQVLKRLFGYLRPYRRRMLFALSIYVMCVTLTNLNPFVDRILIDQYIAVERREGFYLILLLALAMHILNQLGAGLRQILVGRTNQHILYDLRCQLFNHIQRLSFSFFESVPVGSIMTRFISDLTTLNDFLAWQMAILVYDVSLGLISITLMFLIDAHLALVALLTLPVLVALGVYLRPRIRDAYEEMREAGSRLNVFLAENISGMRVIQAFVRQNVNLSEFGHKNSDVVARYMHTMRLQAWFMPVVELTRAAGLVAVLYVAAQEVGLRPSLTVGTLVAFTAYINNLWGPINTITNMFVILQSALTSANRAFTILDTQADIADTPDAKALASVHGDILFDNVSFGYDPAHPVLRDIHLHIPPGQMVALVGQTGSGKTTIASLVCRFYDVTAGRILVDNIDIRTVQQRSLRQHIGVVLQDPFIFSDTIANNIRYARPNASMDEVITAATFANAHDFILQQEDGYDTICGERGAQFSQGQRQLISIARAILANPRILILDEATSAVDTQTEMLIQQALERLMQGRTAIVIAHRLSTIRRADQIVVLKQGTIAETGTHTTLIDRPNGYYAALCKAQGR